MAELNDESNGHVPGLAGHVNFDVATKTRSVNGPHRVDNSKDPFKWEAIEETANYLLSRTKHRPRIAIILGSGLGGVASVLHNVDEFLYPCIPNFIQPKIRGHAGRLLFGELSGKTVVCMQGRIHAYEGYSMWQVTFPVRVFHAIGVQVMVVTNASGSLRPDFHTGDIMIIRDHINLPGMMTLNPLFGLNDERFGKRFPPMSTAYDFQLRALANQVADELGMRSFMPEGVYFYQAGPCFETVAESRMAKCLGADVIGMSTCPEVIVARHGHRPIRCVGLSLVSNQCVMDYDGQSTDASHSEVLQAGYQRADDIQRFLAALVARISLD